MFKATSKTITGAVYANGAQIGSVTGSYIDEYRDEPSETAVTRSISVNVYINGVLVGSGSGSYEDKISHASGGVEQKAITGAVYANGTQIGSVSGVLEDQYGAVVPLQLENLWNVIMQVITLVVYMLILLLVLWALSP
jgi:hypothetical protein